MMPKTTTQISIECTDQELIESATSIILDSARRAGAKPRGPFLLPTQVDHYAAIMSNGRKARFSVVTHIRQIRLEDPKPKAMACLVDIELPSGVEIRASG